MTIKLRGLMVLCAVLLLLAACTPTKEFPRSSDPNGVSTRDAEFSKMLQFGDGMHYWYDGGYSYDGSLRKNKINPIIDSNLNLPPVQLFIQFIPPLTNTSDEFMLDKELRAEINRTLLAIDTSIMGVELSGGRSALLAIEGNPDLESIAHKIHAQFPQAYVSPVFGGKALLDSIIVQFQEDISDEARASIVEKYGLLEEIQKFEFTNSTSYAFRTVSVAESLTTANSMVENGDAVYASPNWMSLISVDKSD